MRNKPSVLQKVTLKVTSKHFDNIRDFVCVEFYQAMENNQMILMARPQMSTHLGDNFRVSSSRSRWIFCKFVRTDSSSAASKVNTGHSWITRLEWFDLHIILWKSEPQYSLCMRIWRPLKFSRETRLCKVLSFTVIQTLLKTWGWG